MNIFFQRKNIFIEVFIAILLMFLADNVLFLTIGNTTEGKVIRYVNNYAGGSKYPSIRYPVIQYRINDKDFKFNGNWDADYRIGDNVSVIYRPFWPRRAKIYTFWGIAKRPLIQLLIILIIWIMIFTSVKPTLKQKR